MNVPAKITRVGRCASDVVRDYFDAFGAGDLNAAVSLLSEHVVWHVDGSAAVPTTGLLRGRDRVRRWLATFPEGFTPRVFAIDRLLEDGEDVVALGRFRHLARSTGRLVGSDLAIHFRVRSGQIERYQILEDSLLLSRAFDTDCRWTEQEVRLNGVVHSYDDRGDGPVVLFAHGLFVDRSIFSAQVAALESTHRCLAFDMPGHGRSGWRNEGWTLDDIADDLALWIEEAALGPVCFVGQSQGGMVGMRLAARRPDLVSRLVLIGTSARAEGTDRLSWWQHAKARLRGDAAQREMLFMEVQARLNDPAWLAANKDTAAAEREVMLAHDPEGLVRAIDAACITRADIRALLPTIPAPTIVVAGQSDRAMPPDIAREIASLMPDARLELLSGVGHHPPIEAPGPVTEIIRRFISERGGAD